MTVPNGSRLRCRACSSEAIVVKSQESELTCCGQPLEEIFTPSATPQS